MTLYELFYFFFRNKWLIIAGVLAGVMAAGAAFMLQPRVYRSEAKLLVRYVSDTMIVDPAVSADRVLTPGRANDTVIGTEVEILTSPEIASTAARALVGASSTNNAHVSVPMTARQIARSLQVQVDNKSSMMQLYFDGPSPEAAQRTLAELINAYLSKHQEVHRDPGAFEFISRQTDEMRTLLNSAEDELRRAKNEAGITSLADSRAAVMARIQDLDRAIGEHESALVGTRARMQVLSQQVLRVPVRVPAGDSQTAAVAEPETEDALLQLADLKRREAELLRIYTPNSVPVTSVRLQIDAIRRAVGRQPFVTGINTNAVRNELPPNLATQGVLAADRIMYEAEDAALLAQLEELQKQKDAALEESKRIEASEAQIQRLERTREMYDAKFRYFSQRLESSRVDSALDASKISNIPMVQPPTLPDRPTMKGLKKLLAMIMAACAGCGLALAYVREYVLDQTIRHPPEVPRLLQIPLLATLPRLCEDGPESGSRRGQRDLSISKTRELDSACEVVAQLIRAQVKHKEQTLLVGFTAPHTGVGVTTVAERVAKSMQLSGIKNVLLANVAYDGQFVGKLLGANTRTAVAQALPPLGDREIKQEAAEPRQPDPVRMAYSSSEAISPGVLDEFNQRDHDCVLIDLPPLNESDVTVRLLPRLDGVVLVLETLKTPRSQAVACVHQLDQLRCCVYGAVLNKFTSPVPAWLAPPPPAVHAQIPTEQAG